MSTRDLPPLPALRVFDAAARHGTFTAAAEELGMTQAAVSYQIRILEERVGAPLFERYARGVGLTVIGMHFFQRVSAALDIISDAYDSAKRTTQGTLSISAIPTFATNFLAQRLGGFQIENADMAVRLEISETITDFATENVDVAVRGGRGKWDGLISHLLLPDTFTPMLSPELADKVGGITCPEDLLRFPILSQGDPWWQIWFTAAGIGAREEMALPTNSFGPQVVEAAAAISGHGVAMLTPAFFQDELERGELVQPFDIYGDDGSGYWLVYPESREGSSKIRKFRFWLENVTKQYRTLEA